MRKAKTLTLIARKAKRAAVLETIKKLGSRSEAARYYGISPQAIGQLLATK